jgi:hypothetical protein
MYQEVASVNLAIKVEQGHPLNYKINLLEVQTRPVLNFSFRTPASVFWLPNRNLRLHSADFPIA